MKRHKSNNIKCKTNFKEQQIKYDFLSRPCELQRFVLCQFALSNITTGGMESRSTLKEFII